MQQIKESVLANKVNIYWGFVWVVAWFLPWGKVLSLGASVYVMFMVDMVKLGLALGMFLLPGVLLFLWLQRGNGAVPHWSSALPVGFALSVTLIGFIGVLGRILGLPFLFVKSTFALIGLSGIFFLPVLVSRVGMKKMDIFGGFRRLVENTPLLLALMLSTAVTFNGRQFFIDDTTYAAYAMNWQHSTQLGFKNIVYQVDVIEQARYWLALYPMVQAILADVSGIPTILLFSNYLELFLVPFSLFTAYWFACGLGLSRKAGGVSVLIQAVLYVAMVDESWPVGFWFYENMVEDKVSAVFLLAPVFFLFVLRFLEVPKTNNLALVFLSGAGLALTHPVILFLSFAIAGGLTLLAWYLKRTNLRDVLQLSVVLFMLMIPAAAIRLYDRYSSANLPFDAESVSSTFQAERYVNIIGDRYYGLNLEVLKLINISPDSSAYSAYQVVRFLPAVLVLLALFLALFRIRGGMVYWYITTCGFLIALAAIPYTGWVLGYFISARMISRVSWFLPLGLSGGILIMLFQEWMSKNEVCLRWKESPVPSFTGENGSVAQGGSVSASFVKSFRSRDKPIDPFVRGSLTGLMFTGILLISVVIPRSSDYFEVLNRNLQLARVGAYIDRVGDSPTTVIALAYSDLQLLPSVSARASLISFREEKEYNPHNYFLPIEVVQNRVDDSNIIRSLDPSVASEDKCTLLDAYEIRFLLARIENVEQYLSLMGACKERFIVSLVTSDMILLEYR